MNPVIVPPSVKEQIEEFLAETNVKKSDVFIIGGGVNEASISGFTFTGTQTAALLDARVEQLFNAGKHDTTLTPRTNVTLRLTNVTSRYCYPDHTGARNIILSTLPDLATLPRIKGFPAQIQAKASNYSRQFRDGVLAIAEKWDDRLSIEVVDIWEISNDILAKPEKFGFDPSKMFTPCYPGSYTAFDAPICAGPDRYPWFDLSNPSAAMHRHLARYFKKAIEHL